MTQPTPNRTEDESPTRDREQAAPSRGEVSEGGSAFGDAETAIGGADAVPDTPDINPGTPEAMQDD